MKGTKDELLNIKESAIIKKLDSSDKHALEAFEKLDFYFFMSDLCKNTTIHMVFDYIYVKRVKMSKWQLANACGVSESTLFRIRHEILRCFSIYNSYFEHTAFELDKIV